MILVGDDLRDIVGDEFEVREDAVGVDVHVSQEVCVMPHDFATVPTDETLDIPVDAAATITGRSTHMRQGVTMPGGIVDPGYRGHLMLEFFNHSNQPYILESGDAGGRLVFFALTSEVSRYGGKWADLEKRFHEKYERGTADECWEWQSAMNHKYGHFSSPEGWSRQAHRVAWRLRNGDPGDSHVLHTCDNHACVNPNHLYLGDDSQNQKDAVMRGKHGGAKLNMDDVRTIRSRYEEEDVTQEELADEYDIAQSNISRIVNWRRYS